MQKHRINILNNAIFLTLLLLPFFKPASLEFISLWMETFFNFWRVAALATVLLLYLLLGKASKMIIAICAYEAILLISAIVNGGDFWHLTVNCGTVIGFCMLTELCIKQNSKIFFTTVFAIYSVLVTINLILLFIFPEGIAVSETGMTYNLLGNDNSMAVAFELPLMCVACLYSAFKNRRLTFAASLMLAMISATVLITWSATGVVAWFGMIVYILFIYKGRFTKTFNAYLFFLAFVILQIMIVFLRLQEHFAFIINNILGKDIDFSGRTVFWDLSYLIIMQSPVIGHGVYEGHGLIWTAYSFGYAHNAVLEIMIESGAVGLILFIIPFVMSARKLYRYREHFLAGIVSATIFSFLITFLMEAQISSIWIFGFLVIAYHIPTIIQQHETCTLKQRTAICQPTISDFRLHADR